MGCCAGKSRRSGSRKTKNLVISGAGRTPNVARPGKRKDRKIMGFTR